MHNESGENMNERLQDWRNEHGDPSFEFLQSLADDGSPGALEKLRSIATDLDVDYDSDISSEDLIGRISSATRNNPNTTI